MRQSIIVRHNVEMGHRLYEQPESKCANIHGHSWWVELEIAGEVDEHGMILDFGDVKKEWRSYLDEQFDHKLCLNDADPLARPMLPDPSPYLPGLVTIMRDPTVENMAQLWGQFAQELFGTQFNYSVKVWEAATNAATWRS